MPECTRQLPSDTTDDYIARKRRKGLAAATVNRHLSVLRTSRCGRAR